MKDFDLTGYYLQTSLFGNLEKDIPFTGSFDGNGHTISNITIKRGRDGSGLFGYIASTSETETTAGVKNLLLTNVSVQTDGIYNIAGALAGYVYNGFISNCAVRNGYVSTSMYAGGLAGYAEDAIITDSCFVGTVEATLCAGGLAGGLRNSMVDGCYTAAEIMALDYIDGIAGFSRYSEISNCYWDSDLCPIGNSPTPLNSQTMKSVGFWYNNSGWDLVGESVNGNKDTWQVANNYYPWLSFETPEIIGDINQDQKVDLLDFMVLSLSWLSKTNNSNYQIKSDLDNNGIIDISDLQIIISDWQNEVKTNWH